jgi:N-acetylmuramoyl-L-alanine amidase
VEVGPVPRDTATTGIIRRVRAEPANGGTRVTLDLEGSAYRRVFYLEEPYRIVVDIAHHPPGGRTARGRRSVRRVAIDPGHGGRDTGAIGTSGVKEKDVTLDIAQRTAAVLARSGVQVLLTRDDDRTVSLEERTARANAFGADLFVSVHCNASENHGRRGVETYVLDTSNDLVANQVAARENATSAAASTEVGLLLTSMRLADQSTRSTRFADLLQRAGVTSLRALDPGTPDGGTHRAGFYVLVGARMPSVLLETGYLSNPEEEQRLAGEEGRKRLADAIVNAVRAYREGR